MDMHGRATQSLSLSRIPIATNPSDRFFERIEKGVELRKTLLLNKVQDDDFVIFCVEYDPILNIAKEKSRFSKWTGIRPPRGLCIVAHSEVAWEAVSKFLASTKIISDDSFRLYRSKSTRKVDANRFMHLSNDLRSQCVKGNRLARQDDSVRAVVVIVSRRTSSAGHSEILILRRGKTAPWKPGFWSLPGGVVEKRESLLQAGLRELKEETDLDATSASLLGKSYYSGPTDYCMQAILVHVENFKILGKSSSYPGGLPVNDDIGIPENDAFKWITQSEIEKYEQCSDANRHLLAYAFSILDENGGCVEKKSKI